MDTPLVSLKYSLIMSITQLDASDSPGDPLIQIITTPSQYAHTPVPGTKGTMIPIYLASSALHGHSRKGFRRPRGIAADPCHNMYKDIESPE